MVFTKRLREGVRRGEITCSVRIWTRPHVRVGGRYPMEDGAMVVDSIEPIWEELSAAHKVTGALSTKMPAALAIPVRSRGVLASSAKGALQAKENPRSSGTLAK
jgi:hypothetical protein